jgi:hypothetical protein
MCWKMVLNVWYCEVMDLESDSITGTTTLKID